jgi:pimeloyl-ACP methyl ester carboxylesterase
MKKAMLVVFIAITLFIGLIARAEGAPAIVIIGGAGSTEEQLEPLHQAIKGSVVIIPEKYYPLSSAAKVVRQQIIRKGITGNVILVGWSWGALIAHQMNGMFDGYVVSIIAVASPLDIAYVPSWMGAPFNPDDEDSLTPLYIIAGVKPSAQKKWYMTSSESDGVVDVHEALSVGSRNLKEVAIIRGENAGHYEMVSNPEVVRQVVSWLGPLGDQLASK